MVVFVVVVEASFKFIQKLVYCLELFAFDRVLWLDEEEGDEHEYVNEDDDKEENADFGVAADADANADAIGWVAFGCIRNSADR